MWIEQLNKSYESISRVQKLNTKLQQQLISSNQTIAKLAARNLDAVTGGDSFAYVVPIAPGGPDLDRHKGLGFSLVHHGNDAVSGITVKLLFLGRLDIAEELNGKVGRSTQLTSSFWDLGRPTGSFGVFSTDVNSIALHN